VHWTFGVNPESAAVSVVFDVVSPFRPVFAVFGCRVVSNFACSRSNDRMTGPPGSNSGRSRPKFSLKLSIASAIVMP